LLTKKGRQEHGRFLIEGPTLLAEAVESGAQIEALFIIDGLRNTLSIVGELEARSIPVHAINGAAAVKLSDVETPTGIIAVCVARTINVEEFFSPEGLVLILADLGDPGNAGTLLRSADAFGVSRVLFGSAGVEPFHPKVVRSSMGALFRATIAVASPEEVRAAAERWQFAGLSGDGDPDARRRRLPQRRRGGLDRVVRDHATPRLIALSNTCQDSLKGRESQDYPVEKSRVILCSFRTDRAPNVEGAHAHIWPPPTSSGDSSRPQGQSTPTLFTAT